MANKSKKPAAQKVPPQELKLKHIFQLPLIAIPLRPRDDPFRRVVANFPRNTIVYPAAWLGTLNGLLGLSEVDLLKYVPSLDKLEEDFADVSKALCLRFPSEICNRTRFVVDSNYHFLYDVR